MAGHTRKRCKAVSGSEELMENGSKQLGMERTIIGCQGSESVHGTVKEQEDH